MRVLKKNDYDLLNQLFKMSDKALLKTLLQYLRKEYPKEKVFATEDYVFAEGSIPVTLVAHLDTVFSKRPEEIYYDERKGVMWSPQGLGADDRAGVFAILKILRKGYRPHVIFTMDEEVGGKGAVNLISIQKKAFAEMKYIIELDRRGTNDCVFYECENDIFTQYVESFGFTESWGSFSDISEICPAWGIAGVNLSVGYQDEHSYVETLHINPLYQTIDKVIKMLEDAKNIVKPYTYIPSKYSFSNKALLATTLQAEYDIGEWYHKCAHCKKEFLDYELFPIKMADGNTKLLCTDCVSWRVKWCRDCGEPFEIEKDKPNETKCFTCRKNKSDNQKKGKKNE